MLSATIGKHTATPDSTQFKAQLEALNHPQGQFLEIRTMRPGQKGMSQSFHATPDEALAHMTPEFLSGQHVFFGVAPRIAQNGTKAAVRQVTCLWADLDGHGYPGGKSEALFRISSFELPPTLLIDSGNGYHAYWTLEEPFHIHGEQDIRDVEGVLAGLIATLGADPACKDINRILRVAGSLNLKDPSQPKPVMLLEARPKRRYPLRAFRKFVQPAPAPRTSTQTLTSGDSINALLGSMSAEKHNRHNILLRAVGSLLGKGISAYDTYQFLVPHALREDCVAELDKIIRDLQAKEAAKGPFEDIFAEKTPETFSTTSFTSTSYTSSPSETGGSVVVGSELALITFNDLLTAAPREVDWRVTGMFPVQGIGVIAGQGGLGKSWLAMDLALSVAKGCPWMGHYLTQVCPVLYVDLENSLSLLSRRYSKLAHAQAIDPATLTNLHFHKADALAMDTLEGYQLLAQAIAKTGAKLVILDSLTRIHTGDENTVKDMSKVSRSLLSLASTFNACIIVIDHLGKANNGLRGSTEKRAMPETIIEAEGFSDQDNIMKLKVTKLRATGDKPEPFLVQLKDLSPDSTVVRIVDPTNEDQSDLSRDFELEWVLEAVERNESRMPRPDLEREAKAAKQWGQKKVTAILGRGIEAGKLKMWSEPNPKTKRLQNVVELVREVPLGGQMSLAEGGL